MSTGCCAQLIATADQSKQTRDGTKRSPVSLIGHCGQPEAATLARRSAPASNEPSCAMRGSDASDNGSHRANRMTRQRECAIVHDRSTKRTLVSTIVRHDERIGRTAHRIATAVRFIRRDGQAIAALGEAKRHDGTTHRTARNEHLVARESNRTRARMESHLSRLELHRTSHRCDCVLIRSGCGASATGRCREVNGSRDRQSPSLRHPFASRRGASSPRSRQSLRGVLQLTPAEMRETAQHPEIAPSGDPTGANVPRRCLKRLARRSPERPHYLLDDVR